MKIKKHKLLGLLIILLFPTLLIGCGKLENEKDIKQEMKDCFPNTKIRKIEIETINENEKIYHYENNEFSFVVENKLEKYSSDGLLPPMTYSNVYTDYHIKMLENKEKDIQNIANKYGIGCYFSYKTQKVEKDLHNTYVNISYSNTPLIKNIVYSFSIVNNNDIDNCFYFIKDIENLLKLYYPKTNTEHFKISQVVNFYAHENIFVDKNKQYTTNNLLSMETYFCDKWEYSFEEMKHIVEYNYANLIKDNIIINENYDYDNEYIHKPKYINSLYINNNLFTSEKYKTEFIYNPIDNQYYTIVCFGKEFDYNGGVKDYLQREIIEKYYKNNKYIISNEENTTTYTIGKNDYTIIDNVDKEELTFKKNNKNLKIKSFKEVCNTKPTATYYYYISLEDFTTIMEMKVDNVDTTNGIIYLKTIK